MLSQWWQSPRCVCFHCPINFRPFHWNIFNFIEINCMWFCFISTWKTKSWQIRRLLMWHSSHNIWEYASAHQQHPSGSKKIINTSLSNFYSLWYLCHILCDKKFALWGKYLFKYIKFNECGVSVNVVICIVCIPDSAVDHVIVVCWSCLVMQTSLQALFHLIFVCFLSFYHIEMIFCLLVYRILITSYGQEIFHHMIYGTSPVQTRCSFQHIINTVI